MPRCLIRTSCDPFETFQLTDQLLDPGPWSPDGFRSLWRKACRKAGISGFIFHDLRGTSATRLVVTGAGVPEIASITGHSAGDVKSILEKHYLHGDPTLAVIAIAKLERGTKIRE